jgi:hypothetical protein
MIRPFQILSTPGKKLVESVSYPFEGKIEIRTHPFDPTSIDAANVNDLQVAIVKCENCKSYFNPQPANYPNNKSIGKVFCKGGDLAITCPSCKSMYFLDNFGYYSINGRGPVLTIVRLA